mmetsp:Transcript_19360/g.46474  ORF Transcript_19360/g.46474 Transcript_19360/m.46474 type:complete len:109 (+) Transcript_19360:285-611(+)
MLSCWDRPHVVRKSSSSALSSSLDMTFGVVGTQRRQRRVSPLALALPTRDSPNVFTDELFKNNIGQTFPTPCGGAWLTWEIVSFREIPAYSSVDWFPPQELHLQQMEY